MKIKSRAEFPQPCYTEYTLDSDSGDTSETVVTYNADETIATEKRTKAYLKKFIKKVGYKK